MGKPKSKYKPEFPSIARQLCVLGATHHDLAKAFGVSPRTITTWEAEYDEFKSDIQEGRDIHDSGSVQNALLKRAMGYDYEEKSTEEYPLKSGQLITKTKTQTRHVPPDTQAAVFWLVNRMRGRWADIKKINFSSDESMNRAFTQEEWEVIAEISKRSLQESKKVLGTVQDAEEVKDGSET